jgi:hypothetical protein
MIMSNVHNPKLDLGEPMVYHIRLKGFLGPEWVTWFQGLAILQDEGGDTLLIGPVADQASLYGLLKKVRDLGLPLLSVNCAGPVQASAFNNNDPDQNSPRGEA